MKSPKTSLEFGTFNRNVLSEQIAVRLLDMIKERKLNPGDRLPPERELAVMMQVSRPSLREALRALSIMGVIENRQGSGTYVTSLEPEQLVEHINFILALDVPTFIEVLEARKVIEVGLAAMAAQKISSEQLQTLEKILEQSETVIDNPDAFVASDIKIHNLITEAAQNGILSVFMTSLTHIGQFSRRHTVEISEVPIQTLEDHRRLLSSLQKRDPQAAAQAMRDHLDYIEKRLREHDGARILEKSND